MKLLPNVFVTTSLWVLSQGIQAATPVENWLMLDTDLDFAFVSEQAPVVDYQKIVIDPINVWHPATDEGNNIAELKALFQGQVTKTLSDAGFEILEKPQPGALRLHVEVIDLKLNPPANGENPWQDRFLFQVSPGKLSFVAEVRDVDTDAVLLRLADHEKDADFSLPVWEQADQQVTVWSQHIANTLGPITQEWLANR